MAREMDRNADKVQAIATRIAAQHVVPTARRIIQAEINEAKARYGL